MAIPSELVSKASIFVQWDGGNVKSHRITKFDETDDSSSEVVTAMGVDGGAGHRDITGGGSLDIESLHEETPEIPWRELKAKKKRLTITVQNENGMREQFQSCRVANVARSDDDKGSHMDKIKVNYLRKVELPVGL